MPGPAVHGRPLLQSEVQAHIDFGFDGTKLDGCGEFRNLSYFAELFNKTGKAIMIENCHWGSDGPGTQGPGWCPFNFFRTRSVPASRRGFVVIRKHEGLPTRPPSIYPLKFLSCTERGTPNLLLCNLFM